MHLSNIIFLIFHKICYVFTYISRNQVIKPNFVNVIDTHKHLILSLFWIIPNYYVSTVLKKSFRTHVSIQMPMSDVELDI